METCRTCAKCDFENETNWLDLFHSTLWMQEMEQIRAECQNWQLEIAPNDGLPQKICTDCFSKFCNVTSFRCACQEAQLKLNNIFDRIETQSMTVQDEEEIIIEKEELENVEEVCALEMKFDFEAEHVNEDIYQMFDYYKVHDEQQIPNTKKPNKTINILENTINEREEEEEEEEEYDKPQQLIDPQYTAVKENISKAQLEIHVIEKQEEKEIQVMDLAQIVDNIIEECVPIITITTTNETNNAQLLPAQIENNEIDEEEKNLEIIFECKYCFKSKDKFHTQKALLMHISAAHSSATHPFACPQCDEGFQDAASRTMHMKAVHVTKHYKCKYCNKQYADRFNLRHHVEKYHSETDFECKLCEKRFYSRKSLNYHAKWHNPECQLKCSYIGCDRLFINQRHLKSHEETHASLRKSEICTFCGKCK